MRITLVLLAAGEAKRMNGKKIQHKLDGDESMLEKVLTICNAFTNSDSIELDKIIVTNDIQERFVREKAKGWQVLINDSYKTGMASSIIRGLKKAIENEADALLLFLSDMPYVAREDVQNVIESFWVDESSVIPRKKRIIRPYYENIPGFPVLFGSEYFPSLMALKGDIGAKSVIGKFKENLLKINSTNKGSVVDIDTLE